MPKIKFGMLTQASIASAAKITPAFLSHIVCGRSKCPSGVALALEDATGVDVRIWLYGTPTQKKEAVLYVINASKIVNFKEPVNDCWSCKHAKELAPTVYVRCDKRSEDMEGKPEFIKNGWFYYPSQFAPEGASKECGNYEQR
jgi:hypothetical protein